MICKNINTISTAFITTFDFVFRKIEKFKLMTIIHIWCSPVSTEVIASAEA